MIKNRYTFLSFSVFAVLLFPFFTVGQSTGNEWIDFNLKYYKIPVTASSLYRISPATLAASGISSAIPTNTMRLFGKEKEQPIFISEDGDGILNGNDYIEFYAQRNDGWKDSSMFDSPEHIGNPSFSLYNDTLIYFFTWGGSGVPLRYTPETASNFSSFTPIPFVWNIAKTEYHQFYNDGKRDQFVSSSFFTAGEGWGTTLFEGAASGGSTFNANVTTPNPYLGAGAPNAIFEGKCTSYSNASLNSGSTGNHHARWSIGSANLIIDQIWIGFNQRIANAIIPSNELVNGSTPVVWSIIDDQFVATDYQSLQHVQFKYPRTTSIAGYTNEHWILPPNNPETHSLLNIDGSTTNSYRAYSFGSKKQIPVISNGTTNQLLVLNTGSSEQEIHIQLESTIPVILNMEAVNGTGNFTNFAALPLDSCLIVVYPKILEQSAAAYTAYRQSIPGGNHNVILANVDELYLQYGAGINKHINGIRNFVGDLYASTANKPVGLFLFGKAVREATELNSSSGVGSRQNASSYAKNLVPSYGFPSSDYAITAGMGAATPWEPLIPTGRISAVNNAQASEWINKLQTYEASQNQNSVYSIPEKAWQKQILHFGGGSSQSEQESFRSHLDSMKRTIEGANFAGTVQSFFKETSNPINPVQTSIVNEYLRNGVSIMNFFGHASADGFDQSIDEPGNWDNTGKYPFVIGNACYTGDIYAPTNTSTSEKMVLAPSEGAIGFLSSVKYGFANYLYEYTTKFYKELSVTNYGKPIAEQIKYTIRNSYQGTGNNVYLESSCLQMAYHGDPVMKINYHNKPEIAIIAENTFIQPTNINLATDSITYNIIVTNLGKAITTPINVEVTRDFPLQSADSNYIVTLPFLNFKDTIQLKMPLQPGIAVGINQFKVQIDLPSVYPEQYDELGNNQLNKTVLVNINGIEPVLPYEYAVVPNPAVILKASTINPIAPYNTYRFEIDTTDLFNSTEHRYYKVSGLGGVKEVAAFQWLRVSDNSSNPLLCTDSTCYFWRVAIDSTQPLWRESSFQYISGKTGWGQDHFFQFKNNNFSGINYNRTIRQRALSTFTRTLSIDNYDHPQNFYEYNGIWYKISGQLQDYGMCSTTPSLHVVVIDPVTLDSWKSRWTNGSTGIVQNPTHFFGNVNDNGACRNRAEGYFIFRQNNPIQMAAFNNMINNEIPEGHYVIIYSTIEGKFDQWDALAPTTYATFQSLGSTDLINPQPNKSFIFFAKKGDPASKLEIKNTVFNEYIQLFANLTSNENEGSEVSTKIGPAAQWNTLYWKQNPLENPNFDYTRLRIKGLDIAGNVGIVIDTAFSLADSILNLNAIIPASQFPFLKLEASYSDTVNLTPAQNNRWHVLYETLPEAAIDGTSQYTWLPNKEIFEEGENVQFATDIKNIYTKDMDSILVKYWIVDKQNVKHPIAYLRQDSLTVGETFRDTVQFNTLGFAGINSFWMEVNPYVNGSLYVTDQPEQQHFNNLLERAFTVNADNVNPILDVTFNGQRILNEDIVNPISEIVISLKDDNELLIMNSDEDTTHFGIYLTDPNGLQTRIPFMINGQPFLQWIPANSGNKKFKIIYPAIFEIDGTYKLLVQASDKSGNISGDFEYNVDFEVIRESTITRMMNYPNPFSTSTKFVFTLTGSEVPDELLIQIMTVSGKVVREITEDQIGPIQIGRNVTNYAWDGKDEYGDFLANGVYLYRVITKINGEDIKLRETGADKHFKKDFGKMYILR